MLSTPMSPWMLVISLVDHLLYWWRVSPSVTRDFKQSILGWGVACNLEAASPSSFTTLLSFKSPPKYTQVAERTPAGPGCPQPDAWASPRVHGSYLRPGPGTVTAVFSAVWHDQLRFSRKAISDTSVLFTSLWKGERKEF